jgi:hypothetical protein
MAAIIRLLVFNVLMYNVVLQWEVVTYISENILSPPSRHR